MRPRETELTPAIVFRALRASLVVAVVFALYLWGALGWPWAHSFLFFAVWSVANLQCLSRALLAAVGRRGWAALGWFVCLPVLFAILLLFFARLSPTFSAFAAGFHLPYVVLALKIIGWRMTRPAPKAAPQPDVSTEDASHHDA